MWSNYEFSATTELNELQHWIQTDNDILQLKLRLESVTYNETRVFSISTGTGSYSINFNQR
jgi:hypothetical protein